MAEEGPGKGAGLGTLVEAISPRHGEVADEEMLPLMLMASEGGDGDNSGDNGERQGDPVTEQSGEESGVDSDGFPDFEQTDDDDEGNDSGNETDASAKSARLRKRLAKAAQAPLPGKLTKEFTLEEFNYDTPLDEEIDIVNDDNLHFYDDNLTLTTKVSITTQGWPEDVACDPHVQGLTGELVPPRPTSNAALSTHCANVHDWNLDRNVAWLLEKRASLEKPNETLRKVFTVQAALLDTLAESRPNWKYRLMTEELVDQIQQLKEEKESLEAEVNGTKEGVNSKQLQVDMAAMDDAAKEEAENILKEKIATLHLKTIKPRQEDYYMRLSLRKRIEKRAADRERVEILYSEAAAHNYPWEHFVHWTWFGDQPYNTTIEEALYHQENAMRKAINQRVRYHGIFGTWNVFATIQMLVEQNVGRATAQVFVFYQFIMLNNLIMSNLWTFFVIIPFFFDPPERFDFEEITWVGLLGLDDKYLEYSWFYYGAYKGEVDMGFMVYRMDFAYLCVYIVMFIFQLGAMAKGVYDSTCRDKNVILEVEDELEGIHFSATILGSFNHTITNAGVQEECNENIDEYAKALIYSKGSVNSEFQRPDDMSEEQARLIANTASEKRNLFKFAVARFVGVMMYFSLFQISTNGIRFCYDNEVAIREIFQYGVPVLVTSMRVLVPFLLVPLFLKIEMRDEPNLFYHTIVRMFVLKMYTMNILLQILLDTKAPDGLCQVIFIGKVYWRQEMADLVFSMVLDAIMAAKRLRMPKRPKFDREELAERVMELLYRQAFIWVSAPYSPMLAYLGLMSTTVLFFWQGLTITISYTPEIIAWNNDEYERLFRLLLMSTALATFYPTWIFLHSTPDCGPHFGYKSPYVFVEEFIKGAPDFVGTVIQWLVIPSTSVAWLIVSSVLAVYQAMIASVKKEKTNRAIYQTSVEYADKAQLLRSQGVVY